MGIKITIKLISRPACNKRFTFISYSLHFIFALVKKVVAIFFLFIYSFTTVGATIHSHYCMSKYMGSSLYHPKNNKCEKCGMAKAKSKGCCKDEHKYISLKREHNQTTASVEVPGFFSETLLPSCVIYDVASVFCNIKTVATTHSPPLLNLPSLNILYCIFRI